MTKKYLPLLALSVAVLGLGACSNMDSPTSKPPGTYKSTSESTNANGTTTKTDQTTHVYRDSSGNKKAVVETEQSRDPDGLFNKEKSTTYKKYE